MESIKKQFEEITKIKIFEVEVTKKGTKEKDYIIFNISIDKNKFVAQHEGLTKEEETSEKIAYKSILIDPECTIDENLQELYNECINAILQSDFFNLID